MFVIEHITCLDYDFIHGHMFSHDHECNDMHWNKICVCHTFTVIVNCNESWQVSFIDIHGWLSNDEYDTIVVNIARRVFVCLLPITIRLFDMFDQYEITVDNIVSITNIYRHEFSKQMNTVTVFWIRSDWLRTKMKTNT
jgi:hypothetical protein